MAGTIHMNNTKESREFPFAKLFRRVIVQENYLEQMSNKLSKNIAKPAFL
jgi:hypothetical protein